MKKTLFLVCLLHFVSLESAQAQQKKLTIEDAVLKQRTTLAPKRLPQLQWIPGTSDISYVENRDGMDVLVRDGSRQPAKVDVITLAGLNEKLKSAGSDTLARWPAVKWTASGVFRFEAAKTIWQVSTADVSLAKLDSVTWPADAQAVERSDSGHVAFVMEDNLWVEKNHLRKQVTRDGSRELVYGQSVHRDEFGISKGLFWSPDAQRLAFYRMDQSMVTDYPIIDFTQRPALDQPIKYPFAGDSSHQVTVGIYDLNSGNTVYLKTEGPVDQYLTNVSWSPDGKFVYIAVLNREQNHMRLNRYSAITGEFDVTLFEEHDPKYTEPQHPLSFIPGSPKLFIWQSRRDGWNHLYLYDTKGNLIRQLTKGEWEVTDLTGFDPKGKRVFFTATTRLGINRDFFNVDLASGKLTYLTSADGVHACIPNQDFSAFIDSWSSPVVPRMIRTIDAKGKVMRTILEAPDPLKEYAVGTTRLYTIIAADEKTPLWCRMILPAGFDSTKRYPVIVYVYGGPHAQMITNTWLAGADLWFHYLTQQGFIVFTVDNRGSSNRGREFEQATFRRLGDEEMKDQIAGVNHLKNLPFVDPSRIGVNGWSYGGFMTTSLMTRYPGVFKAGVAGGPVIDWSHYEVMYTERYMDTPAENPDGYKLNSLLNHIDKLNGRLMLIHGTSDDVVVWQHSIMLLKKAVDKGVQLDYFVYPGHPHNVSGKDRVHLNQKITRYFEDFLK